MPNSALQRHGCRRLHGLQGVLFPVHRRRPRVQSVRSEPVREAPGAARPKSEAIAVTGTADPTAIEERM